MSNQPGNAGLPTMRPLRICFPYVGDDVGGSHISSLKLIEGLDRARFNPIIVLHQTDGSLAKFLTDRGHKFLPAPSGRIIGTRRQYGSHRLAPIIDTATYLTRGLPGIARFITSNNIDIVHTNDGRMHTNWGLATRLTGAKMVWHHRGDPIARGVNVMAPWLCHQLITVSAFALPKRPIRPVQHKAEVVHSPFEHPVAPPDRAASRAALLDELDWPAETRLLGYFGQLISRKRPVAFVDAIHAFMQAHPEIPVGGLLFGAPAPDEPHLEAAVSARAEQLGISDRIRLMGFRSPVEPCMAGVDILLVPALNEPFGRTLIEAMFLGTPLIATNHGGNPEAIDNARTGFLIPPENPAAFTAPIHELLSDPICWQTISETARTDALENYSAEKHIASISNIYQRLGATRITASTQHQSRLPA